MKKYVCLLLSMIMLVTFLASCQGEKSENSLDSAENTAAADTDDTEAPEESEPKKTSAPESEESGDTSEEEPEEPTELPDMPSVLYYTEYTDRVNRLGEIKELCTIDPEGFTVTTVENEDGSIYETVSYSTESWYIDVTITDTIELIIDKYDLDSKADAVDMLCTDNLHIYTAIDPVAQEIVENYFEDSSNFTVASGVEQPEASMVITDPATGDIIALVGGRGAKGYDEHNFATVRTRQPGSSIKPLSVYGPALEEGIISYSTVYEDSPYSEGWPENYPSGYRGATQIHDAICRSVNTIAVKVLMELGAGNSIRFLQSVSISTLETDTSKTLNDRNAAALGLGGMVYGVTNRELTAGYQIYANNGQFTDARTVVSIHDRAGELIIDNSGTAIQILSEGNADIMTLMLEKVVDSGTADDITLNDRIAVAGKTGTTDDMKDKWFIGYTPYYLGGVWFGYAQPKNLDAFLQDESPATKIWQDVMTELHEAKVFIDEDYNKEFSYSDSIVQANTCSATGLRATEACPNITDGYFTSDNMPAEYCSAH